MVCGWIFSSMEGEKERNLVDAREGLRARKGEVKSWRTGEGRRERVKGKCRLIIQG